MQLTSIILTFIAALLVTALSIGIVIGILNEDVPRLNYICSCNGDEAELRIEPMGVPFVEKANEKE